jgi:WD40 repeat protein
MAVSPDGTRVVSSSLDDTVVLWDAATGRKIYTLPGHGRYGGRRAVGFTRDGRHFLSWGDDLYLRKWDVATGKAVLEHALRPHGVEVPDGDDDEHALEKRFALGEGAFAPEGQTFVLAAGNEFHVFDVASGKDLRQIPNEGSHERSLAISPDGTRLLASAWGKSVRTKLSDGRVHFSVAKDHPVCLWDLATGQLQRRTMLPEGGAGPVAFSADGRRYATACGAPDQRIQVWDTATGRELRTFRGLDSRVGALAFTPDGRRLISGMDNSTALVWDLADPR